MPKTTTIQNGLTSKNISDLNGATILEAAFASKKDTEEINETFGWYGGPIILIRVRLSNGTLLELMPTQDPEGNGPGFLEVTPLEAVATPKEPG